LGKDSAGAARYLPIVETLLHNPDPEVQFEAACALAKYRGATDPEIQQSLIAGLGSSSSRQLMTLESIHGMFVEQISKAEPNLTALFVQKATR
jgi:hypothetical protein